MNIPQLISQFGLQMNGMIIEEFYKWKLFLLEFSFFFVFLTIKKYYFVIDDVIFDTEFLVLLVDFFFKFVILLRIIILTSGNSFVGIYN